MEVFHPVAQERDPPAFVFRLLSLKRHTGELLRCAARMPHDSCVLLNRLAGKA